MGLLVGLNWMDVAVLGLFLLGMALGYTQGLIRQIITLATLYIGAILGAQYYHVVAGWVRYFYWQAPARFVNALSFFAILVAVAWLVGWLATDAYRSTRVRLFPVFDQLGGSLLGVVTIVVVIALFLPIITFASSDSWPWAESARLTMTHGMQTSRLLPTFDLFKPRLLNALGPWLPTGLPSIFNL